MSLSMNYFGDRERAKEFNGLAMMLLYKLENRKKLGNLKQIWDEQTFSDGTTIRMESIYDKQTVWITSPFIKGEEVEEKMEKMGGGVTLVVGGSDNTGSPSYLYKARALGLTTTGVRKWVSNAYFNAPSYATLISYGVRVPYGVFDVGVDDEYGYLVGGERIGAASSTWKVAKIRDTGKDMQLFTLNIFNNEFYDAIFGVAVDDHNLYLAGVYSDVTTGWGVGGAIAIIKKTNGELVQKELTTPPSDAYFYYSDITADDDYIYVVANRYGTIGETYTECWKKSDLSMVWQQIKTRAGAYVLDTVNAVTNYGDYTYEVGEQSDQDATDAWRIIKRNKSDGAEVWVQLSDAFGFESWAAEVIVYNDKLYVCGKQNGAYEVWRVEERSLSTGALLNSSTMGGTVEKRYIADGLFAHNDKLYVSGYNYGGSDGWYFIVQCINLTTWTEEWVKTYEGEEQFPEGNRINGIVKKNKAEEIKV